VTGRPAAGGAVRSGGLAVVGGVAGFWEGTAGATGGVFAGAAGCFGGAASGFFSSFFSGSTAWASLVSDADTALSFAGAPVAIPASAIWTDTTLERTVPAMSSR